MTVKLSSEFFLRNPDFMTVTRLNRLDNMCTANIIEQIFNFSIFFLFCTESLGRPVVLSWLILRDAPVHIILSVSVSTLPCGGKIPYGHLNVVKFLLVKIFIFVFGEFWMHPLDNLRESKIYYYRENSQKPLKFCNVSIKINFPRGISKHHMPLVLAEILQVVSDWKETRMASVIHFDKGTFFSI